MRLAVCVQLSLSLRSRALGCSGSAPISLLIYIGSPLIRSSGSHYVWREGLGEGGWREGGWREGV